MNGGQITGLVIFGLGALTAVVCHLFWRQQRGFWQRAVQAEAMVVGHQQQAHRGRQSAGSSQTSTYTYYARHPLFAFRTADGRDVHALHGTGSRRYPAYHSGQLVQIHYDPQDPDTVATGKGGEVPVFRTLIAVGAGVALLGVIVLAVAGG